jgi:DNA-binding SARP family transcriptional activator
VSNPAPFHLLTLGHAALVDSEGTALVSTESAKLLALLTYLAATPGRHATRDHLIDLFWADSPSDKARNSLRQSLHKLRELLGDDAFHGSGSDDVVLQAALTTDRDSFLAALDAGDLETALACYGGPFAGGFVSAGSAGFEHWSDHERERLHDLFAATTETVARRMIAAGNPRRAELLARRLLDVDLLDEVAWRLRLEAEVATGTGVHLAASIAELRRRLHEVGREPEPRTRDLLQALSRPAARSSDALTAPSLVADLVGRQPEFTSLYAAWRITVYGRGAHVHVAGAPGLGKTRLLEDLAIRLGTESARVVTVRATPRQRTVAASVLGTVVSALADLPGATGVSPESAGILVELQPAISARFRAPAHVTFSDTGDRDRVRAEALCDLLAAVSEERPLALLLDDLHWWDQNSRTMIANVIERTAQQHIFYVTASRPGEAELRTESSRRMIDLVPLDQAAVGELVSSLGDCDDTAEIDRLTAGLHRASGGVPLLVLEALRLGLDRGWLELDHDRWTCVELGVFLDELQPESLLSERLRVLSREQRDLLLLTALAERPVDAATMAAPGERSGVDDLIELERHGMLRSSAAGWLISHDTIAENVIALAGAEAQRIAHRRLGEIQLIGNPDAFALKAAMEHFCQAGQLSQQRAVALAWLSRRRAEGDERPIRALLAELLGPYGDESRLRELQSGLPRSIQRPRWLRLSALAAGMVLFAAAAVGVFWWWNREPPDAEFELIAVRANHVTVERDLPLRLRDWEGPLGRAPLTTGRAHTAPWQVATDSLSGYPIPDPTGRYFAFSRRTAVNGPTELYVRGPEGDRTIAPASGDDVSPSWAPDGSAIAFSTTRYPDGGGTFDLAVVDVGTGRVRRLTATRDGEWYPRWSPDGSRIAFIRKPEMLAPDQVCWVTVDARTERCVTLPVPDLEWLLGWIDPRTVLVMTNERSGGHFALRRVNLSDGSSQLVLPDAIDRAELSPDGRWVVAWNELTNTDARQKRLFAFPVDQPSRLRGIVIKDDLLRAWSWRTGVRPPSLASVLIRPDRDSLFVPGPVQLTAEGRSASGQRITIPRRTLHWSSSDSGVASIDDAGRLEPHHDGVVTIAVSAGGWRGASVTRTIVSGTTSLVMHESWSSDWLARWMRYGDPLPMLFKAADGTPSMLVNGDNTYSSGVYSIDQYDATHGLAVDAQVQTPITRSLWQNVSVELVALAPGADEEGNRSGEGCLFRYPAREGGSGVRSASVGEREVAVDPALASGRWFRLRIQFFPDGTCGYAIDGHVLDHGSSHHPSNTKFAVRIDGQTAQSRLLVGPLTVWEGVPPGVNWDVPPDSI